ncbi:MAG TPA: LpqB family beta-propeller domain-containing protein [Jiangellales bacterium]|nr:LpqB family beta-propeller domain-containing protein [Jiangellales bacterium]
MADRRSHAGLGALLALVLVLSGCASIPTTGPVVPGDPVRAQDPPPYVGIVAAPPRPGADEVTIVNGFLSALSSYVPGYPTAREYLSPDVATAWQPGAGAVVFDADTGPVVTSAGPGEVRLGADVVARLGPDGSYTKEPPGSRLELDLRLDQVDVDGSPEWRIATPPEGILLSDFDFEREFASYDLYFFDPQFQVLVPDPVHLPRSGSVTTLLAEALLTGPSDWLEPAVLTAFPDGVQLDVRSVPVSGGQATVALTPDAAEAPTAQREQMAAQLSWTLRQVPEVQRVTVTAGAVPLLGDSATPAPVGTFDRYDPAVLPRDSAVFVVTDGVVASSRGGAPRPVGGPLGLGDPLVRSVAADPARGSRGVAVDETGTELLVSGFGAEDARQLLLEGLDLAEPAWDRTGVVWALDRGTGALTVVDPATRRTAAVAVEVPGLESPVDQVSVSLDGTRAAVRAAGRVWLAVVLRDAADPLAIRLDGFREIPLDDPGALDVAWADPSRLGVLHQRPEENAEVLLVEISGAGSASRGTVPGAVALAAAPGQALVTATDDGRLLRLDVVLRWTPFGEGTAPAYQG